MEVFVVIRETFEPVSGGQTAEVDMICESKEGLTEYLRRFYPWILEQGISRLDTSCTARFVGCEKTGKLIVEIKRLKTWESQDEIC